MNAPSTSGVPPIQARESQPPLSSLSLPSAMLDLQQFAQLCHRSIDQALQALVMAIATACRVDCCLIAPLPSRSIAACYPPDADFTALLAHPALSAIDRDADLARADLPEAIRVGNLSLRSLLAVRVHFQDRAVGLVLMGRTRPTDWEGRLECWQPFSSIAGLAIGQVLLQQQLQQQTSYQTWMQQLSEAIRATSKIEDIFALAIEATTSALAIDRGSILLLKYSQPHLDRRSDRVPVATVTLAHSNQAAIAPFQLADCKLCQQAFLGQPEPVLITGDHDSQASLTPLDLPRFPALLLMPLTHQKTVLGFLALQHQRSIRCPPEAIAWVRLIATQLSTAIIQTRAFQQIYALVDDRTAQLQRSLEMQAKLYEKTRQQVDQLRYANQLKDEFLSTMSHELRTPLTSMTLAIRMLRQSDLSFERQQRYLDILEQQCTQEANLINDLLALQKLDAPHTTLQIRKIDLKALICDRAETFERDWSQKNLSLALDLSDRPLTLYTNLDGLDRILLELLTNAGKYSAADSTVHLQVRHEIQSVPHLVLRLSNVGAAISPDELPFIFDRFRRGRGITQQAIPGTGLGLALVKSLVAHLKGAIEATSQPLANDLWQTCMTLTLPEQISSETKS